MNNRGRVLITGGAGFIGSHLGEALISRGYEVRALDSLAPQVHGSDAGRPPYLHPRVELLVGDVRDREAVDAALEGVDAVIHLAAAVGVGQSMYQPARYTSANNLGTATLLEAITDPADRSAQGQVRRLVVASSMSVYGEGMYRAPSEDRVGPVRRTQAQLLAGDWEPRTLDGQHLRPVPTPEDKAIDVGSVYALSKYDQERLCLLMGQAYDVPTVALRLFNVYGPRQALSNPYTGVLAIFAARLLHMAPPLVYEDGLQRRDFVSIHDVVEAFVLALERDAAVGQVLNIGSGESRSVLEIAQTLARALERPFVLPYVTGKHRKGDIRHCFADIGRARALLGYEPHVSLEVGVLELARWVREQVAIDLTATMSAELERRGLVV